MLLPPSLDELIAENHHSRIVNAVIDSIDLQFLIGECTQLEELWNYSQQVYLPSNELSSFSSIRVFI